MAIKCWQKLSSRYAYKDKWLKVRVDTCKMSNGQIIDDYHIVEYPEWVIVVPITSNGKILLIREYRHGAQQEMLGLPAGTVEPGDNSTIIATQRELEEETGYTAREYIHLGSFYANPANQQNRVHSYLALDVVPSKPVNFDSNEQIEVAEMKLSDFLMAARDGSLEMQGLNLAALFLAEKYLTNMIP